MKTREARVIRQNVSAILEGASLRDRVSFLKEQLHDPASQYLDARSAILRRRREDMLARTRGTQSPFGAAKQTAAFRPEVSAQRLADIRHALAVLSKSQHELTKRNSRRHDEAADDNVNRMRALEGICGVCPNLIIEKTTAYLGPSVALRCRRGLDPMNVYRLTPWTKEAQCAEFNK